MGDQPARHIAYPERFASRFTPAWQDAVVELPSRAFAQVLIEQFRLRERPPPFTGTKHFQHTDLPFERDRQDIAWPDEARRHFDSLSIQPDEALGDETRRQASRFHDAREP
jgi:hypothetical protein